MCGLDRAVIKAAHNQKNGGRLGTRERVPFRFVATGWMGTRPRHRVNADCPVTPLWGACLSEWCRYLRRP
jgi:hypothetical protein